MVFTLGLLGLSVILIRKSNYSLIVTVNCLFLLLCVCVLSLSAVYFTTSVEIKIIVELMQPRESNYIAIIPFGCRLIEVVIFYGNMSCMLRDKLSVFLFQYLTGLHFTKFLLYSRSQSNLCTNRWILIFCLFNIFFTFRPSEHMILSVCQLIS